MQLRNPLLCALIAACMVSGGTEFSASMGDSILVLIPKAASDERAAGGESGSPPTQYSR